ncbi:MAG: hypothetical protein DRP87_18390 [Spirochaetes bacterium]|nr:MAG: hypothetical protein DRP87_18390 [Spirochaetota bacterium]
MTLQEVTVLGSGTLLSPGDRSCSAYLLDSVEGSVLLDCGSGTLLRLNQSNLSPEKISNVLITHFHLDHASDIPSLLMFRWLIEHTDGCVHKKKKITISGPVGLKDWYSWILIRMEKWIKELDVQIEEIGSAPLELGGLQIEAKKTFHTEESVCLRLTDERGSVLFYSGDTGYQESTINAAKEADLAIMECSFPDTSRKPGHLTPSLAGKLAGEAQVKQLLLTHFYPEVLKEDIIKRVRNYYTGPVFMASDLSTYRIRCSL